MVLRKSVLRGAAVLFISLFISAATVRGDTGNTEYDLPTTLPITHKIALKNAGWNGEKIVRFSTVYERYRKAHAFVHLPQPIPGEHLLLLAEWVNVVTRHRIDPYLIAAIHQHEVYRGRGIGACSFYGDSKYAKLEEHAEENNRLERERKAFRVIIADIKKNPRWRTLNPAYPVVSCAGGDIGYFQIRPTVWLHYRDKVGRVLGLKTTSPYELIPAVTAANFILHDKIRYLKLNALEVNLENSLYFAQVAASYNAGAAHAKDTVHKYGIAVYETAREMRDAARNIALTTVCARFVFTYPGGERVCENR